MKVFVMVDMEGISGIVNSSQIMPDRVDYEEGRRYLTADVNACVKGCIEGGVTEIVVLDSHFEGSNFIWGDWSENAQYINGGTGHARMPGIGGFDGLILLGYHAKAGSAEAVLEHTMSSKSWQNFWVNGELFGEIGIDAAYAGHCGVPAIMVSGDDKACAEAREIIPGVVTAEVKKGLSLFGARLLSPDKAHELITIKSREAVQSIKKIKPFKVSLPVTMRLELVERNGVPNNNGKPWMKIIDNRTYEVTSDDYADALARLLG